MVDNSAFELRIVAVDEKSSGGFGSGAHIGTPATYHVFVISVRRGERIWTVRRRYSRFHRLYVHVAAVHARDAEAHGGRRGSMGRASATRGGHADGLYVEGVAAEGAGSNSDDDSGADVDALPAFPPKLFTRRLSAAALSERREALERFLRALARSRRQAVLDLLDEGNLS